MKWASAIFLGGLSAVMVYVIVGTVCLPLLPPMAREVFAPITLSAAWIGSAYLMLHEVRHSARVWVRGSLLGACEWIGMAALLVGLSGKVVWDVAEHSTTVGTVGIGLMMTLLSMMGVGFSMVMVVMCLLTWFIANRFQREFQLATEMRYCPQCQQQLQGEADWCPQCGASLL